MTFPPEVLWDGVLRRLAAELPAFAVDSWLAMLVYEASDNGIQLLSPNAFHRDRVRDTLLPQISAHAREIAGRAVSVRIEVGGSERARKAQRALCTQILEELCDPEAALGDAALAQDLQTPVSTATATSSANGEAPLPAGGAQRAVRTRNHKQRGSASTRQSRSDSGDAPVQQSFEQCFDNFVVGDANALAREVAVAIAEARHAEVRQLYLHAASGQGKTHLARAVCALGEQSERVRFVTAEGFTNEFMASVRGQGMETFKRRYRKGVDLLVVDDVHFFEGKLGTQLELFHTVQHVVDAGGRVVLTGNRPVSELTLLEPQLRDRIGGGFVAKIEPPDAQLRRSILRQKASAGGVRLPEDCLDLLVESIQGSVRDLDSALVQLVTTSSLLRRDVDVELALEVLATKGVIASAGGTRPQVEQVIKAVAQFFNTTPAVLSSRSRRGDVNEPRQIAMVLCRRFTNASLREIGDALGRQTSSVRNAIRRIERQALERAPARYKLEAVSERVRESLEEETR